MAKKNPTWYQAFLAMHKNGHTIPECAKLLDICAGTIYHNLAKIAEQQNLPREYFLTRVPSKGTSVSSKSSTPENQEPDFASALSTIASMRSALEEKYI